MGEQGQDGKDYKDDQNCQDMGEVAWFLIGYFLVKFLLEGILAVGPLGHNFVLTLIWFFGLWGGCFSIRFVSFGWILFFLLSLFVVIFWVEFLVRDDGIDLFWVYFEGALGFHVPRGFGVVFGDKLYLSYRLDFIFALAGFLLFYLLHWLSFLLLFFFILLDETPQFAEKLDAEHGKKNCDEDIRNNWGKDIVEDGADGRSEEDAGDDDHHYVVVDQGGVFGGVTSEHQQEEVVEGRACYQWVAQDCGVSLGVVEGYHEEDHLELPEGVARCVAQGWCEGEEAVDGNGVALEGEDRLVEALVVGCVTVVLVGAGEIGSATYFHHFFFFFICDSKRYREFNNYRETVWFLLKKNLKGKGICSDFQRRISFLGREELSKRWRYTL